MLQRQMGASQSYSPLSNLFLILYRSTDAATYVIKLLTTPLNSYAGVDTM